MELFSQEYFERAVRHTVPSDAPETLIQKSAADMRNCVDMGFKDGLAGSPMRQHERDKHASGSGSATQSRCMSCTDWVISWERRRCSWTHIICMQNCALIPANTRRAWKDAKSSAGGLSGLFSKVGSVTSTVGKGIFNVASKVAAVSVAATTAGAAAVSALTTLAVNSYADYEQLVGGVETLYKDSAAKVQQYAADAYKTSGMTANEYMTTATSYAAALVSSLGGDTEQAAELSNMAVSDMADNWNKFGSSADSVQAAYNGFAKGQFQLLDNLKLGYGGTKEEMERLLDDANKLNAAQGKYTDYSIDSFSDIILAIHDIQTEYDITGTTAKEASTTISGSLSAAKAAWQTLSQVLRTIMPILGSLSATLWIVQLQRQVISSPV